MLLVATAPLMAILAICIRVTSSGPAFYSQSRVGRNGRIFLMHKLRTMHHMCETSTGPIFSPPNDSRITAIGKFLRISHLDELPQLVNVLQGHMALIGPRPERPELCTLIEQSIPRFHERLQLRPGITGLAQTQLPADLGIHTVQKKLESHLYYVREVNPWLDLCIAISTFPFFSGVTLIGRRSLSTNADDDDCDDVMPTVIRE